MSFEKAHPPIFCCYSIPPSAVPATDPTPRLSATVMVTVHVVALRHRRANLDGFVISLPPSPLPSLSRFPCPVMPPASPSMCARPSSPSTSKQTQTQTKTQSRLT
ncbi:hypothetical protein B0H13DRAFT_2327019 [Mycena leptocephala]|nr:hypothetical protein B0H13DRAFT_2327019 [Mycena leptocephala]